MLKQHTHMPVNVDGRDWFCGDLHGHYSLLMQALDRVGFNFERDRLFCTGDLIDRGPESAECVHLLLEPWFNSVCGNHECLFIVGRVDPKVQAMHIRNGGAWAYEITEQEREELFDIIRSEMCMTVYSQRGSIGVIHGQPPGDWHKVSYNFVPKEDWKEYLWSVNGYNRALSKRCTKVERVSAVVMGHVGCDYLTVGANQVWIDTVVRSGRLTVIESERVLTEVGNG
ncbi:metallophosphoesterase [Pontibacterium granulatum]|uniref:metallophosphoesterase n=1 Tax=Pontibacterium granulatum TaxID=2036029 RepID=UPI00249B9A77|nr:metallophosphoesterase [Pontibacterium granulatum]MDI3326205.1 metallophosphoesterase [Pontibacterium granulatum]